MAQPAATANIARDHALDCVKGALVLLMVLYHWLNYFIGLDWPGYPFLRFLTPSFLFITGLIVGRVYFVKYAGRAWLLAQRSVQRGLKLLTLCATLNIADSIVAARSLDLQLLAHMWPAARIEAVLLHGTGGAAFSILIPIAYFIIAVPAIHRVVTAFGIPLPVLAAAVLLLAIAASMAGHGNAQLEFFSIGLAGAGFGSMAAFGIGSTAGHLRPLVLVYLLHLAAIALWNAPFVMQVLTVYLNVMVLYALATRANPEGFATRVLLELGSYSLLAYVAQIVALQFLRRALPAPQRVMTVVFALVAAGAITWASVRVVATLRARSRTVDGCYRAVFA